MHRVDPEGRATGRKIGVVITISGDMSMKVPSTSRTRLIISRMTIGLSETAFISLDTSSAGMRRKARASRRRPRSRSPAAPWPWCDRSPWSRPRSSDQFSVR
jgi:hypothetical protein